MSNDTNCSACGAEEGQLHRFGCDMERCPFCGHPLFYYGDHDPTASPSLPIGLRGGCGCCYHELGTNMVADPTEKEVIQWRAMLDQRGRIPYLRIPHDFCTFCGKPWGIQDKVPDEEWQKFVVPALQDATICRPCYDRLVRLFPDGWRKARPYSEVDKSK